MSLYLPTEKPNHGKGTKEIPQKTENYTQPESNQNIQSMEKNSDGVKNQKPIPQDYQADIEASVEKRENTGKLKKSNDCLYFVLLLSLPVKKTVHVNTLFRIKFIVSDVLCLYVKE